LRAFARITTAANGGIAAASLCTNALVFGGITSAILSDIRMPISTSTRCATRLFLRATAAAAVHSVIALRRQRCRILTPAMQAVRQHA